MIPYVPGLSERVARIFKKAGKSVFMRPGLSLAASLVRKKPQLRKDPRGLIYLIPCKDCHRRYIGETGRPLPERISEHKRAVRVFHPNSEVAHHVHEENHAMDWDSVRILGREEGRFKRIFKEAWHTKSFSAGNRVFTQIDPEWNLLF